MLRATSNWTSRISYEDVASMLSMLSVCVVLMRFYSFNDIRAQHNLKFVSSAEFENFINKWVMNLYYIATAKLSSCIKRDLKRLLTISMTRNARQMIDELLNSSNGLLRSASSPGIASIMLMRFYPIITRCNESVEAAHAHIDEMSCCKPPPIGPLGSATKMLHRCWACYLSA